MSHIEQSPEKPAAEKTENDKTPPKPTVNAMTYAGENQPAFSWIMGLELSAVSKNTSYSGIEYMLIDSGSAVMATPYHTAAEHGHIYKKHSLLT